MVLIGNSLVSVELCMRVKMEKANRDVIMTNDKIITILKNIFNIEFIIFIMFSCRRP